MLGKDSGKNFRIFSQYFLIKNYLKKYQNQRQRKQYKSNKKSDYE